MSFWEISAYVLALGICLILIRIFIKPIKTGFVLALSSLVGGGALYLFNSFSHILGFGIAINIVTAVICGVLGVPGFVFLVILKLFILP